MCSNKAARCAYCLGEYTCGILTSCPYCGGFSCDSAKEMRRQSYSDLLLPETVLKGRYMIGTSFSDSIREITYYGRDMIGGKRVYITEYFPTESAKRNGDEHPWLDADPNFEDFIAGKAGFIRKAEEIRALGEPKAICRMHDVFEENNTAYAVYEYIDAGYIPKETGVFSFDKALSMLLPLMDDIEMMGVPLNAVSSLSVRISDDGIKCLPYDMFYARNDTTALPLLSCAAPERYQAKAPIECCPDVYDISSLLYTMITGERLYGMDLLMMSTGGWKNNFKKPSEFDAKISPEQENVLLSGLEPMPKKRLYQSVTELRRALTEASSVPQKKTVFERIKGVFK